MKMKAQQNLWDTLKGVIQGKLVTLLSYVTKSDGTQINGLIM